MIAPAPPAKAKALERLRHLKVPEAADFVVLGDSNAAGWPSDLLEAAAPGCRIFNFGLPGDRVQNTLWRLDALDTAHLRPRHVIVTLGTNNLTDGDAPALVAAGLLAVIGRIDALWAEPEIVLTTITRRPAGALARAGERAELNRLILGFDRPRLRPFHADPPLDPLGPAAFEPDGIHVSRAGYESLAAALAPLLTRPACAPA